MPVKGMISLVEVWQSCGLPRTFHEALRRSVVRAGDIPAHSGVHSNWLELPSWPPHFAGMTEENESKHRRGIPSARSNLSVARRAIEKYLVEAAKEEPDKHNLMLYYGSFFFFARAALYALEGSDGKLSPNLKPIQSAYFNANIGKDPIFVMLKGERDRIGHGDDSWGLHPMIPVGMIGRFIDAGHDWDVPVFDEIWPDDPFRGETIDVVMNKVWRAVSNWLDAIDALDEKHREVKRATKGSA